MKVLVCQDCGELKSSSKGIYCKTCGYKHRERPNGLTYILHKENATHFKKGCIPWNKDKSLGELSPVWKGDNVGYDALHGWVERRFPRPKFCSNCGSDKHIELANLSGQYKRDLSDWKYLCKSCHHKYDNKNFGKRRIFFR